MKKNSRPTAVAGSFYPSDPKELSRQVWSFIKHGVVSNRTPKAIIAPHAGYVYSGPIAGSAYKTLLPLKDTIKKVVLLGPAHRVGFRGIAAPSQDFFSTPLGDIPIDRGAIRTILKFDDVKVFDEAHGEEHSLEVHLPFLQSVIANFSLIPLVVGMATPEAVENVLTELWGGPETLIVISSDLSHYESYERARVLDKDTTINILDFNADKLNDQGACGIYPIRGFLKIAAEKKLTGSMIDLRNSGDTAGSKDRVVGYGAYVFS